MRTLALTAAAVVGLLAVAPAQAAIYMTNFSGTVQSQIGTSDALGSTVSGSFTYSSDANRFLSFTIDGFSASPSLSASVTTVPAGAINPYEAIYTASTSAVQTGNPVNTSFSLDLLAYNSFTGTSALSVLATPNLGSLLETLSNSFDGQYSSFTYYNGTATTASQSLTVALNASSLNTTVPEPASLALLATPLGFMLRRRR